MTESQLTESKSDPPSGYGSIGLFETKEEAMNWYEAAIKAKKTYPFWLNKMNTAIGMRWVLWWQKPKNAKKCGKGFK